MSTEEQSNNRNEHLKPWQFKPGQSGNPGGRPKGSISLKTRARNMLESMTEEEAMEFLRGLDKKDIWQMAEGKPDSKSTVEATVQLDDLTQLPDEELDRIIKEGESGESKEGES